VSDAPGQRPDVLVIGGGNAALCAALTARDAGARVMLLERASPEWRGGNSKYTRNVRVASAGYPGDEFLADLTKVTGEGIDLELAAFTIDASREAPAWMEAHGIRWQPAMRGTLQLSRTNRFFLGGGKALVNTYFERARAAGVDVRYGCRVTDLSIEDGVFRSAAVESAEGRRHVEAAAVVVASGGFESNLEWLRRYWGDAVDNYLIRGTGDNDGVLLARLLDLGGMERGNPRGFHAVACDARSPRLDGGIVTRVDALPFGITVNRDAKRFHDEGEDEWPKRYAAWGRLIALQPGQEAYTIVDRQVQGRFIPPVFPPYRADTIEGLAAQLGLDGAALRATVDEYNRAVDRDAPYDVSHLDGKGTRGLEVPKTNWALPIERPPFAGYPLRPGITFTYLAVGVDRAARVLYRDGTAMANVFAAGEVMAGNILLNGYLAGFGMTIGTVFGRLAGQGAADCARAA
jgi:tricarballylate dehydrogenase